MPLKLKFFSNSTSRFHWLPAMRQKIFVSLILSITRAREYEACLTIKCPLVLHSVLILTRLEYQLIKKHGTCNRQHDDKSRKTFCTNPYPDLGNCAADGTRLSSVSTLLSPELRAAHRFTLHRIRYHTLSQLIIRSIQRP